MKKQTREGFIKKAKEKHINKYDYSKVEYINSRTKVCIICPKHGEFWQRPHSHLQGYGCPYDGLENRKEKRKISQKSFVDKAINVHGLKYDYSKVKYVNTHTKVCVICTEHGEFWQSPASHLQGHGCPKCNGGIKIEFDDFIKKSEHMFNHKYDYSNVEYKDSKTKVCIICPKHGVFLKTPHAHLNRQGCPKCAVLSQIEKQSSNTNEFIQKSNKLFNHKYDYSNVEYINNKTKVCIICPEHGGFWQTPNMHLYGQGCPKCGRNISKTEDYIYEIIISLNPQQRNRDLLNGKEIDIYIPQLKLGIEYNGLRWHSEEFGKDRKYHYNKMAECNSKGIRLIQIFEDEWVNHREVCESKLKHICGLDTDKPKIFARKCSIREITNTEAKEFLDKNHIQGFASSTVYLGCYTSDNQLIGVMNFKREKDGFWDLNRFATDINYNCVGVGGKLFKYFIQNYDYQEIKSFADRRWTSDPSSNLYTKLGFDFVEFTNPDYRYFKNGKYERFHKFGIRKQILHKKYGLPISMTEHEMAKQLGYTRIWDCGLIKYVFNEKLKKKI